MRLREAKASCGACFAARSKRKSDRIQPTAHVARATSPIAFPVPP